jgi:glutaredoxin
MNMKLRDGIAELLRQTGQAHHAAFEATDGEDPDWPIWYAEHARDSLAQQFGMEFTKSQLIYCLMKADIEHQARSPDTRWHEFYADEFVEHCARSDSPSQDSLALYYFDGCPFCAVVRATLDRLDIDVELRNVMQDAQHRDALVDARGRATVPVLRITSPDGEERWLPESRDIVNYLESNYA